MDPLVGNPKTFDATLFNHLVETIVDPPFLASEGLGKEVHFYICAYDTADSRRALEYVPALVKQLQQRGVTALHIDLYDTILEMLEERGSLSRLLENEAALSKDNFGLMLRNMLDAEEYLLPALLKRTRDAHQVLLITGVGEVFPYIRSHSLLNNMQSHFKERPVVLFFPVVYRHSANAGTSLDLFDRLHEDHYYRAFDIRSVRRRSR